MTTPPSALPVSAVLASLPVRDMAESAEWLSRFLGRPADAQPMDGLSDWYFEGVGTIQLVLDPQRAGGGILTLQVNDLSAALSALADRGIDLRVDDTTSTKVKFGEVSDPEGNLVTLIEAIGDFNPTGAS
jgi:catechol 2,3-dioxygenase-like lactoylglutathione lyase family enzyme